MGLKFEPKKFKFGMRTLKTGIAVFLVLGLFSALGLGRASDWLFDSSL